MARLSEQDFLNFWTYYRGEPHQVEAVKIMYGQMHSGLLDDSHAWVQQYRNQNKAETPTSWNPLDVPFQSQLDNKSGSGERECFSSSCAMVAMYYGKIANDDAYNEVRAKFGDTTDAQAQVRALRSLGLEANFISNATTCDLRNAIDAGRPIPVGWLHRGPASSPQGSGHWSVVTGYSDAGQFWYVSDPNGEALLSEGGYSDNLDGKQLSYSYKNWNPRWIVEGEGSGWMLDVRDPAGVPAKK